jgi:DNA-binding response OmpR family regulator
MTSDLKPRVLIVEDERPMLLALRDMFISEGYRVLTAQDGESGLQQALEEKPGLLLLDVMMPKLDGYSLCAELRRVGFTAPILMLTAKGQVHDRVTGLDSGADDYLVKPFSSEELLARARALLRRSAPGRHGVAAIRMGDLRVDLVAMTATRGGEEIGLSAREFAMLRLLAEARGEPVTRERFLDVVWGYTRFPTTRTVDTHIAALRAKLETDSEQPRWIVTVHGVGYRLQAAECDFAEV